MLLPLTAMLRRFLFSLALLLPLCVVAQELTVRQFQATNDLSASTNRRVDLNDAPCGLVKVRLATAGATFEGNVIGNVEYKTGEYWVYMSRGSKQLLVKHPSFLPLDISFTDYGIRGVEPLTTYALTLVMPQATSAVQTQKLIINYTPASAMVIVDSKIYRGNGRVEIQLPVGEYSYMIAEDGYVPVDGTVKLNVSAPRTITESLVRTPSTAPVAQQPTVPQQAVASHQPTVPQQPQPISVPTAATTTPAVETITVNGVSFNMVRVDGGTFMMGATSEQGSDADSDEKPAHQVTLSTYSIGETEVTQALWEAVMGKNPSEYKGSNRPVETVSWKDCQAFIQKLNTLTGRRFRLPTEAEWEYAARGGNRSKGYKYSGSNNVGDVAWYTETTNYKGTREVKTKQANELGIYDMTGNVCEWCQDWSGSYSSGSQTNPTGPSSGSNRVFRGGSWRSGARYCRCSFRYYNTPLYRDPGLGLRLCF